MIRPTTRSKTVASLIAFVGLAGVLPSPAFAAEATKTCQPAELAAVKAHAAAAVSRRETTLDGLTATLASRSGATTAHRATLLALYSSDKTGLSAVNATVQADTTCRSARDHAQAIVADYRVYLLVVPQSRLTTAADTGTAGANALAATEPLLQKAISGMADGTTKDQAQALYEDLASQVTTATTAFAGVGDAMLTLTPQGYPANEPTVIAERAKVKTGGIALKKAVKDATQLAALLS